MSKASEWVDTVRQANDALDIAKANRPGAFHWALTPLAWLSLTIDQPSGKPRLSTSDARIGWELETDDLLKMAHWILDTFGEEEGR